MIAIEFHAAECTCYLCDLDRELSNRGFEYDYVEEDDSDDSDPYPASEVKP